MKEKLKTVYYCEFCRKYRLTRPSMARHESSCTLNPNRVCRVRGCKGDCPWCKFSKFRLSGDFDGDLDLDIGKAMEEWWGKKGSQYIIRETGHLPF